MDLFMKYPSITFNTEWQVSVAGCLLCMSLCIYACSPTVTQAYGMDCILKA